MTPTPFIEATERRNARVFASITALIYFSAPVLYVGFVQAGLCKRLQASDTIANLPSALYLAMSWTPVVVAWLFPQARLLRRTMTIAFGAIALMSFAVAVVLYAGSPAGMVIASLVLHAALLGAANSVAFTLNWEAIGRGISDRMRGKALGLAFGWGPACAVVGSLGAQLLLEGQVFGWKPLSSMLPAYPNNYALLYLVTALCMGLAAYSVRYYNIPLPEQERERESFGQAIFGGLASIVRHRVLFIACLCYLLMYCANMVQNNMSIFSFEATGRPSEELAGYQLALRFSFKVVAGLFFGWLLLRTNPKVPLLVIAGLQIVAVLWVLTVPGYWFLIAFGINGAAELFGVYYMNYPVSCSAKNQIRRNVAFLMLLSSGVGFSPIIYGWISDHWGLRASFFAALALLAGTTILVAVALPRRPVPPESA